MSEQRRELPADIVAQINLIKGGFDSALGIRFVALSYEEVRAEIEIGEHLLQPYGLVHGGVYASVAESLASVGAALTAMSRGQHTVGLENHTSFIRAARSGTIAAVATPKTRGRRSQVWGVEMRDEEGRLLATSTVRLLCFEQGASVGGEEVGVKTGALEGP